MKKIKNKQNELKTMLRSALEADGRRLKWLSNTTKIHYQRLQRIANQGYEPSLTEAAKIANALGKSLLLLFPSTELNKALALSSKGDVFDQTSTTK